MDKTIQNTLRRGVAIPAHPLALDANRRLDERAQRALSRYYIAAGAGGLAVAVHTTQFAIRSPEIGLFEPVLEIAAEEMDRADATRSEKLVRIGGVCGRTSQATGEAETLKRIGYHAGLLSLAAMSDSNEDQLIDHCRAVARVIPIVGFYLQPAVGGRALPYAFWRRLFDEVPNLAAVKIAPFNRYQTLDVVRAACDSGRDDVVLYTGNDDNIVLDLVTPYRIQTTSGKTVERRIVGGLLGHWSVWTKPAVEMLARLKKLVAAGEPMSPDLLALSVQVTDANAAFFDSANAFRGCIAGLHEVLRRQGLLQSIVCLDEHESLSPGQREEIDRVYRAYPHLADDAFVAEHRDAWLRG